MHGHGIVGALWQAARRLVTARHSWRVTAGLVMAAGMASSAGAVPVEYDYIGTDFTSVTGVYTTSDHVTGSIVFDSPLLPDQSNGFVNPGVGQPLPFAFTFSDGVNTISSGDVGARLGASGATFVTNAADQIIAANFSVARTTSAPNPSSAGISVMPAGSTGTAANSNGSGIGLSFTAGMWSGPVTVSPPPPPIGSPTSPGCAAALHNAVSAVPDLSKLSASQQPYVLRAFFVPTTGSLASAEDACGVADFDWQQTMNNFPVTSTFQRKDGMPVTSPVYDPQPGGWTYPAYCSGSFTPPSGANPGHLTLSNPSTASAFPFYYQPNGPPNDCFSLQQHESNSILSFFDSPADPSLMGSQEYSFTTCLVGVSALGDVVNFPATYNGCFDWTDNYRGLIYDQINCSPAGSDPFNCDVLGGNGGGLFVQTNSNIESGYPGLGLGGIQLIGVPEPNGVSFVLLGCLAIFLIRSGRYRQRPLYSGSRSRHDEVIL